MIADDPAYWNRPHLIRALLVGGAEDEDAPLWGRCAGLAGWFVEPVRYPRELLTLRGCPLQALQGPWAAAGGLGDVLVEVWSGGRPEWWTLVDAEVLARTPSGAGQELWDVIVAAGVRPEEKVGDTPPLIDHVELFASDGWGESVRCVSVSGLYRARAQPTAGPLHLVGCEPAEPLQRVLRQPGKWRNHWAYLRILNRKAAAMYHSAVQLDVVSARPSVLGGTLIDIVLADGGDDRPTPSARPAWQEWYEGPPSAANRWTRLDKRGQDAWLDLVRSNHGWQERTADRTGGEYHLDGSHVTNSPGLYLALGEALCGPGGYYGAGLDALSDCLCGGCGVSPPFTLVWHRSDIARSALTQERNRGLTYYQEVVALLRQRGVTVREE